MSKQMQGSLPTIRALRDDEPLPMSEPKRYRNDRGYIRLRWLVSPNHNVEAYEHRVVMGRPAGMEVHHKNRVRDDNRPENLMILTPEQHALLHAKENRPEYQARLDKRDGIKTWDHFKKHAREQTRRAAREFTYLKMRELYERGYSTVQIGEIFSCDPSNVSIHLRQVGTGMRPFTRKKTDHGRTK
jgi:hypothetical protein